MTLPLTDIHIGKLTRKDIFVSSKQTLWENVDSLLPSSSSSKPKYLFVPGRIEIVGKHVDYLGGQSLVCATPFGLCVKIIERREATFVVRSDGYDTNFTYKFDEKDTAPPELLDDWARYPRVVLTRLCRLFPQNCKGFDMAVASDLPPASGMSSSSALVVAVFLAFYQVNELESNPTFQENVRSAEDLCQFLGCLENGSEFRNLAKGHGVGTHGGSQDHVAIFSSTDNHIHMNSYDPVRFVDKVLFPEEWVFVIANSGVIAQKSAEVLPKFNKLVSQGKDAIQSIDSVDKKDIDTLLGRSDSKRLTQFLTESYKIVPGLLTACKNCDAVALGELTRQSQQMTQEVLQNQIPETVRLVELALKFGAFASSAFGAGFGGAVWAIVEKSKADNFSQDWINSYRDEFRSKTEGDVFLMRPSHGARWVVFDE